MTLLEDLEAAAQVADINAQACREAHRDVVLAANEVFADVAECLTFARRLREHAARLREEMQLAEEKAQFAHSRGRTRRLVERINGGPL